MDITALPQRRSFNCYSGCITALLERKGRIYSEPVAVGLCGGLNLEFTPDGPLHYRGVRELHCITEFLESRGLEVSRHVEPDKDAFEALVVRNLEADLPLMIEYDGYYFSFTPIYALRHERRIGLIVGFDQTSYRLTDPVYGVEGVEVQHSLLLESRTQSAGAAVEPAWYAVSMKEGERPVTEEAVCSILGTADYMLRAHDGPALQGVHGTRCFAREVKRRLEQFRDLDGLVEFSEELKQGAILFDHYGEFLRNAARWSGQQSMEVCRSAAPRAVTIGSHLRLVAALILKSTMSEVDRCAERVAHAVGQLAVEAELMFSSLREVRR